MILLFTVDPVRFSDLRDEHKVEDYDQDKEESDNAEIDILSED